MTRNAMILIFVCALAGVLFLHFGHAKDPYFEVYERLVNDRSLSPKNCWFRASELLKDKTLTELADIAVKSRHEQSGKKIDPLPTPDAITPYVIRNLIFAFSIDKIAKSSDKESGRKALTCVISKIPKSNPWEGMQFVRAAATLKEDEKSDSANGLAH